MALGRRDSGRPGAAAMRPDAAAMKCPKCGYLGFEPVDRCRNCGYDFSLAPAPQLPELPIRATNRVRRPSTTWI